MKVFVILILALGLIFTMGVSGCVSDESITSQEQAQETLKNISGDIGGLEESLAEIDDSLG